MLLAAPFAFARAQEEITVRIVDPPANRPVSGQTRVAVDVRAPAGSRIVRVEIYVDDQRIATLEKLPFEIRWNAGPEFQPHLIRAVATDDAGRTATAVLQTPVLRIGQRETVLLVNLYVNVVDEKGKRITDLDRGNFQVLEDGTPQEISTFTAARQPISLALLLDSSNSMGTGDRMAIARKSAIDFVKKMDPADRLLVMSFNDTVQEVQSLTSNRKELEKAIEGIGASGGTALYDAVVLATSRLKEFEGRKATVVLSDGRDQALKENAPGSLHIFEEAVDAAVRSEVAIYAIGLGAHLENETDLTQRFSLKQILGTFAEKTGGRFYNPERAGQLSGVYDQISDDLRSQYTIAYSPRNATRDGRWRTIQVRVDRPGLKVLTRPGYFAPFH